MKIFVCLKQVPDTETKIKIAADQKSIETAGVKWVMNPYDEFAVQEANNYRDAHAGSQVWVISVGPKARVTESVRTALAMGSDEGIVINAPEGIDNFSTAKALAAAITAEGGAHLIFSGKTAIDDNSSSVSQMLAELLKVPHATVVSKFTESSAGKYSVERDVEGGSKEVIELTGPSVIAATKGLNMPKYASLPGIMKAKKKVIKDLEISALGVLPTDQKVKLQNFSLPPEKSPVKMLTGDSSAQASQLVSLLRDEAKVL